MSVSASTSTTKHKKNRSKKSIPFISESPPPDSGEGADPNWAFQPPPGAKAITTNEDNGEFDWDAVKDDDDAELWLIRVPHNVKPKHLEDLSLDFSADSTSTSKSGKRLTNRVGVLSTNHTSYDIWSMGDSDEDTSGRRAGTSHFVGGEELRSLSCLLPRKRKKGKLFPAPKPISRHLVVSAHPSELSMSEEEESASPNSTVHKNPQRQKYSPELLKHRFMPYGSLEPGGDKPMSQYTPMIETNNGVPVVTPDVGEKTSKSKKKAEKATAKVKDGQITAKADPGSKMYEVEPAPESGVESKNKKRKGEDQGVGRSTKKSKSKTSTPR